MAERRKPSPTHIDDENPEWTAEEFAKAKPAAAVLPELFGAKIAEELLRPKRGRPPVERPKAHVNIRLDADVVESFRATGTGWQTRMNAALKDWLKTHSPA
ncbi:MAG: BrnA antitoxin family protein [Betaproteobacteria bacterium]|nr:BrnA antitoxin family protein [Betaproteobacteria bacterium]